jgi:hypothetical protein
MPKAVTTGFYPLRVVGRGIATRPMQLRRRCQRVSMPSVSGSMTELGLARPHSAWRPRSVSPGGPRPPRSSTTWPMSVRVVTAPRPRLAGRSHHTEITDELHPGTPVFACALGGMDGRPSTPAPPRTYLRPRGWPPTKREGRRRGSHRRRDQRRRHEVRAPGARPSSIPNWLTSMTLPVAMDSFAASPVTTLARPSL